MKIWFWLLIYELQNETPQALVTDVREMEAARDALRQSMLSWKIVKKMLREGATYLSITALIEKNVCIDTAQQNQFFLMTDISSCLQIFTTIPSMDRDLMILFFLEPSGAEKSIEIFGVR